MSELRAKLDKLLDLAIGEGRCNWDGYYGSDNTFHMNIVKDTPEYKEFAAALETVTTKRRA